MADKKKTHEELVQEKNDYVHPEPKTYEEVLEIFQDLMPTPNAIFLAVELPPDRTKDGIILNREQREEAAIKDILNNGAMIIGCGSAVTEWDPNIRVGNRALVSANIQPTYQILREEVIMRATERHFVIGTRDGSAAQYVPKDAE